MASPIDKTPAVAAGRAPRSPGLIAKLGLSLGTLLALLGADFLAHSAAQPAGAEVRAGLGNLGLVE